MYKIYMNVYRHGNMYLMYINIYIYIYYAHAYNIYIYTCCTYIGLKKITVVYICVVVCARACLQYLYIHVRMCTI